MIRFPKKLAALTVLAALVSHPCQPGIRGSSGVAGASGVSDSIAAQSLAGAGRFEESRRLIKASLRKATLGQDRKALVLQLADTDRAWAKTLKTGGHPEKAEKLLREALASDLKASPRSVPVDRLLIGRVAAVQGRYRIAEAEFQSARRGFRAVGDTRSEAVALYDLSLVRWRTGDLSGARQASDAASALPVSDSHGALALASGTIALSMGRYTDALARFRDAETRTSAANDSYGAAVALADQGAVFHALALHRRALDCFTKALAAFQKVGDVHAQAVLLNNIGYEQHFLHDDAAARVSFMTAMKLAPGFETPLAQCAWSNLGRMDAEAGRLSDAKNEIREAFIQADEVGDKAGLGICDTDFSLVAGKQGDWLAARSHARRAYVRLRGRDPLLVARSECRIMAADEALGKLTAAAFWGKRAIRTYQTLRVGLVSGVLGADDAFTRSHASDYRMLADILVRLGRLIEAQQVLDMLKREHLDEFDRDGMEIIRAPLPPMRDGIELVRGPLPPMRDGMELVRAPLPPLPPMRSGQPDGPVVADPANWTPSGLTMTRAERDSESAASKATEEVGLGRIDDRLERQAKVASPSPSSVPNDPIPNGTARLYAVVANSRVTVIARAAGWQMAATTKLSADALNADVLAFRAALTDPKGREAVIKDKARILCRVLMPPALDARLQASHVERLEWALDGTLRYVPVSALYDGKRYLVERYECSLIGIATAPRTSVAAHGSCAFGVSQAASVPVPGGDAVIAFPALPDVQKETALVRSGDGRRATRLIDGEFTWAHARAAIGRKPSTVHFATHFRLSPDNAAESYLLLGDKSVQSVAALSRQADLFAGVRNLTLSACETANLGDGKDADGLAGVCQRLGAQNVVATLWPTEDPASLTFMEKYYKMASGPTPAARLRQAQLGIMRENASSPRFWAAFVVTVTKNE